MGSGLRRLRKKFTYGVVSPSLGLLLALSLLTAVVTLRVQVPNNHILRSLQREYIGLSRVWGLGFRVWGPST